jgi:hypothetical protein
MGFRCPVDTNVEVKVLKSVYLEFKGRFAKPVMMAWEALQFRLSPEGGSQVIGALQIQPASVRGLADSTGVVDVTVSINVTDTLTDSISHASTRTRFDARSVDPRSGVLLGVAVAAPPVKRAIVRIGIENASAISGAVAEGDIDIDRFAPDSLTMSDVVLSPADSGGGAFVRGDVHVSLAPGRTFRPAETPTLYYELYGLSASEKFTTRIELQPVDFGVLAGIRTLLGRQPVATSFSFDDIANVTENYGAQQVRQLNLANLKPGYYAVKVTVTDSRNRTTTRERFIEIDEQK